MADDLPAGAVQDPGVTISRQQADLPAGAVQDPKATVKRERPAVVAAISSMAKTAENAGKAIGQGAGQLWEDVKHPIAREVPRRIGEGITASVYGLDKGVLGAEEMLPDLPGLPFHSAAARGIQQINRETPNQSVTDIAAMAPVIVGGEATGAREIAQSLMPVARQGASLIPRGLSWLGQKTVPSALEGAVLGASTPTGIEDPSASARQKIKAGEEYAAIGGGLGLAGGALGAGARGAGKVIDIAQGKPTAKAIEGLRQKAAEGATAVAEEKGAESAAALEKAGQIEPKLEAAKGDLAERKATQSQQREQQADAEAAADRILKSVTAEPGISAEKFGERVRAESEAVAKKYRGIREEKAGFKDVFKSASKEPDIDTSNIIKSIGEKEWNTTTGLERVKSELMTGDNKQSAITLEKAHSLKMELDDMWKTAKQRHLQFSEGKAAEEARIYDTLRNQLREVATAKYPKYGEALETFRTRSRPLDFLERKSVLGPLLRRDPYSKEYLAEPGSVVTALLNKAQKGNTTLARLFKENPALKDEAKQFFVNDLQGVDTAKKFEAWFSKRKNALEQTGLLGEFSNVGAALKGAEAEAERAGSAVKGLAAEAAVKQGNVTVLQQTLKDAQDAGTVSSDVAQKYSKLLTEINSAETVPQVAAKTRQIFSSLVDEGKLTQGEYGALRQKINVLEEQSKAHAETVKTLKKIAGGAILVLTGSWTAYHVGRALGL